MKKLFQYITTFAFTLFITITVATPQTPQDIKTTVASTVILTMDNGSQGSGFFVAPDLIATSYSVIKGASSGYASSVSQEKNYPIVGIAAIDEYDDLVILKVSGARGLPLPVGDSELVKKLDRIYIIDNSDEVKGIVTSSKILGLVDPPGFQLNIAGVDPQKDLLVSTTNSPGDIGGPLLNDKGEVIGIFRGIVSNADKLNKNHTAAVPSKYLKSLLAKIAETQPQRFLRPLSMKGVIGGNLTWKTDSYEFTLSNQRNETIYDPYCLIIFKDSKGKIICTDEFVFGGMMFAGKSLRVPRRLISEATDHYHYPYHPENKPLGRPGILEVSSVGASIEQLMQSYEIKIIDFEIDIAFPSQNTPLTGFTGSRLTWFELSNYSQVDGIEQFPGGSNKKDEDSPKEVGFSYSVQNNLSTNKTHVRVTLVFYDKEGFPHRSVGN